MFASNCQARHRRYLSSSVGKYTANRPKQEINMQNFCTRTLTATLHRSSLQPVFFAAAFNLLNPTSVTLLLTNLPDQNTNNHVSNPATNSHSNKATSHVSPITHVKIVSFVEDSTSAIFTAPISVILLPPRLPNQNKQTGQQTSCQIAQQQSHSTSPPDNSLQLQELRRRQHFSNLRRPDITNLVPAKTTKPKQNKQVSNPAINSHSNKATAPVPPEHSQ